jgi:hypothetical protein
MGTGIAAVRGVTGVHDRLDDHDAPGDVSSQQGS